MIVTPKPVLDVDVYRRGPLAAEVADRVEAVLAAKVVPDIDIQAFYAMARIDPILAYPVEQFQGMYPTTGDSVFARAVLAITLQRASIQRGRAMRRSNVDRFGTAVRFDDVTVYAYPTAERLAGVSEATLRDQCGVGYRAPSLRQTAERITDGFIDLEDSGTCRWTRPDRHYSNCRGSDRILLTSSTRTAGV